MTWLRADQLKVGMKTACAGQRILDIRPTGIQYSVTFLGSARRKYTVEYFPDQEFDIALDAAPEGHNERGAAMAQKVNITIESDLSGKPDAETVTFGLDGHTYEIDLTADEQGKLRDSLAKYVGAGRQVKGKGRKRAAAAPASGPSAAEIREWGKSNGFEVPDRGRIPAEVREAFDAAN